MPSICILRGYRQVIFAVQSANQPQCVLAIYPFLEHISTSDIMVVSGEESEADETIQ